MFPLGLSWTLTTVPIIHSSLWFHSNPPATTIPFQRKHADFSFFHGFLLFRFLMAQKRNTQERSYMSLITSDIGFHSIPSRSNIHIILLISYDSNSLTTTSRHTQPSQQYQASHKIPTHVAQPTSWKTKRENEKKKAESRNKWHGWKHRHSILDFSFMIPFFFTFGFHVNGP